MEAAINENAEMEKNHEEVEKAGKESEETDVSSKPDENCKESEVEAAPVADDLPDGLAEEPVAVENDIGVSKSTEPSAAGIQNDAEAMEVDENQAVETGEKDSTTTIEEADTDKCSEKDKDVCQSDDKLTTIQESEEPTEESNETSQNEEAAAKATDEQEDITNEKEKVGEDGDDVQEPPTANESPDEPPNEQTEEIDLEMRESHETSLASAQPAQGDDGTSEKSRKNSEQEVECMDVEMESQCDDSDKVDENKKSDDVENTEFVQFNQDKDDSQLEAQAEAVDPFAGDNQAQSNSNEAMEVDSANVDKPSEVVEVDSANVDKPSEVVEVDDANVDKPSEVVEVDDKSKDSSSPEEKDKDTSSDKNDKEPDEPGGTAGDSVAISEVQEESQSEVQVETQADPQKETSETEKSAPTESDVVCDTPSKETDGDRLEVLAGQDEELSIIPDNSKENDSSKADEADKVQNETETQASVSDVDQTNSPSVPLIVSVTSESETTEAEAGKETQELLTPAQTSEVPAESENTLKVAALTTGANDIQVNEIPDGPSIVTSDIIDLDDDPKNPDIEEITSKEICKQCKKETPCSFKVKVGTKSFSVCSELCKVAFSNDNNKATDIPSEGVNSKRDKRCANCLLIVEAKDEKNLSWETMEFCNEECLGKFQTKYGSYCRNCNGAVQSVSLGKYCVRFGYDVRQFCCSTCLEEFKKGLKVCSYCQKDISAGTEGFLAPVGDKGQFKDFCTQDCMEKYSRMNSTEPPTPAKKVCSVCQEEKIMHCEVQIDRLPSVPICSEPCFAAFKFVNKVDPDQCSTCKKYFQLPTKKGFVVFYEDEAHTFCNKTCLNVFIITNRKIVPCNWCKVKKYNFDMIKKELKTGQVMMMCSLNCLTLYQVSINAVSARRINCDFCKDFSQAQYHLTMSDATIRNFCSYKCVMNFQAQYTKSPITIPTSDGSAPTKDPVPTGIPKRAIVASQTPTPIRPMPEPPASKKTMPVISSVTSLAAMSNGQPQSTGPVVQQQAMSQQQPITLQGTAPVVFKQQVVTRPTSPVEQGNKMTQCRPLMHTKGVMVRPIPKDQSTQTEAEPPKLMPIPLPFYVPFPMHMYSMPFPVPVPIPLPVPVPVFIPTTRNSIKGIMKEMKRIQEKIPADPFEAELLMMAEMAATEKKKTESDSDSNDDEPRDGPVETHPDSCSPEPPPEPNASFGDDLLQMALKMTDDAMEEEPSDLESSLATTTIRPTQRPENDATENDVPARTTSTRGRKRGSSYKPRGGPSKRGKRASAATEVLQPKSQNQQYTFIEPAEKPDANMALKYTFGVNAWRQWVITKNADLEKQSTPSRKMKLFKTDLLQLTADELNYALCLFVKEVRKPNGAEYAPDTIYYLCLGIQQYLFENNRIDNIFTDAYYEKFTDILDEVGRRFEALYSDSLFVVTRVEEEHLWESKQLGAHSPHVLLNTLMYFNTKHFDLQSVEEHKQLSFSHIMKHWKRTPGQPALAAKTNGARNVLLRFYPPQSALEANSKKKKVYEQEEDEENPLRCPVKLYEFYLSKCPESVKTRNDVFYLLPERSCVPDSPVWYSTTPLAQENLVKMLHRIKMVKEINVALLSSQE